MSEPLVCCIMLVNGREAMVRRAVASFRAQAYERKSLLIYDTSPQCLDIPDTMNPDVVWSVWSPAGKRTIGRLRNDAIELLPHADIVCTFDSDDVSHPNRIAEQVALLQSTKAEVAGYYEAAFYDSRPGQLCGAWVYKALVPRHIVGASMCFRRAAWKRVKFPDLNIGEDIHFANRCEVAGVSGITHHRPLPEISPGATIHEDCEPRIICGIHSGNTAPYNHFSKQTWWRAPELDEHCLARMAL